MSINIPNFIDAKIVDDKGSLTDIWKQIFTQLFTQLQASLSDEGIQVPAQSSTNIGIIAGTDTEGRILFNEDTKQLQVNSDGTFKNLVIEQKNKIGTETADLGDNSPATDPTKPYTWVNIILSDGTSCYVPAWK